MRTNAIHEVRFFAIVMDDAFLLRHPGAACDYSGDEQSPRSEGSPLLFFSEADARGALDKLVGKHLERALGGMLTPEGLKAYKQRFAVREVSAHWS